MEELILINAAPPRPLIRSADAFEPLAWRAPAANDWAAADQPPALDVEAQPSEEIPRWVIVVAGAVLAAILGALLGGAMAV